MAHPKRQHSKQRTRKKRTHKKLQVNFGKLSIEGTQMGLHHRVDPLTGMYKGQQIIDVSPKKKKKEKEK